MNGSQMHQALRWIKRVVVLGALSVSAQIAANDTALSCENASYLEVPEDYSLPTGRKIDVAYFRFPAKEQLHTDPVILLGGGGPGAAVNRYPVFEAAAHATGRDMVYLDYRGAGCSRPSLDCIEFDTLKTTDMARAHRCASRLQQQGLNLRSYNTRSLTEDIESLRRSLKVDQLNLVGTSYGSRLALSYLSIYGEHARSAILNAPYPFGIDVFADRLPGATRIIAPLIGDHDLTTVPMSDLETRMENFANSLFWNYAIGKAMKAPLDERELKHMLNNTPPIIVFGENSSNEILHEGLFYSVSCQEDAGAIAIDRVVQRWSADPSSIAAEAMFRGAIEGLIEVCDVWPVTAQSTYPPIQSVATPVLILAQEYDFITPLEWGQSLTQALPNSRLEVLPGLGHSQLYSPADKRYELQTLALIEQLIDDPAGTVQVNRKRSL